MFTLPSAFSVVTRPSRIMESGVRGQGSGVTRQLQSISRSTLDIRCSMFDVDVRRSMFDVRIHTAETSNIERIRPLYICNPDASSLHLEAPCGEQPDRLWVQFTLGREDARG